MNDAIKDYLGGRRETGLLLRGRKGLPMMDDAIKVSSALLGCEENKVKTHPDFLLVSLDGKKSLSVEDAADIAAKADIKPSIADKTVVLVDGMDLFTVPAQNKLLKLIEDGSIIVIGIAYGDVIATIESRMVIVNYNPLSKSEYRAYCVNKSIADWDTRYYITEGVPTDVDDALLEQFFAVNNAVLSGKVEELLPALHLVKEKDELAFNTVYSEYVSNLFSYLSYLAKSALDNGRISEENYEKVLLSVRDSRRRCGQPSYTKDDFFYGIISYIEAFK